MATAMPPTIRPYSRAVTPRLSRDNLRNARARPDPARHMSKQIGTNRFTPAAPLDRPGRTRPRLPTGVGDRDHSPGTRIELGYHNFALAAANLSAKPSNSAATSSPTRKTTAIMATAMPPTIRPYSRAVAPRLWRENLRSASARPDPARHMSMQIGTNRFTPAELLGRPGRTRPRVPTGVGDRDHSPRCDRRHIRILNRTGSDLTQIRRGSKHPSGRRPSAPVSLDRLIAPRRRSVLVAAEQPA